MTVEHLRVVHLIDMVSRKDQNVFGIILLYESQVLENGVGRAGIPAAFLSSDIGGQNKYAAAGKVEIPRLAGSDVSVELQGLILRKYADGINAGVGAVGKGEVDNAVAASEGYSRLCHDLGKQTES